MSLRSKSDRSRRQCWVNRMTIRIQCEQTFSTFCMHSWHQTRLTEKYSTYYSNGLSRHVRNIKDPRHIIIIFILFIFFFQFKSCTLQRVPPSLYFIFFIPSWSFLHLWIIPVRDIIIYLALHFLSYCYLGSSMQKCLVNFRYLFHKKRALNFRFRIPVLNWTLPSLMTSFISFASG